MGKANTKPKQLVGQFEDYTHYGEIINDDHTKRFYLKQKSLDVSFYAWAIPISVFEKIKPEIKVHQALETKSKGLVVKYLGLETDLPIMDKLNRKQYFMLKFDTYDYDLELEMRLRINKQREYEEGELWGALLGVCLYLYELYEGKIMHGNWSMNSIFFKQNRIKLISPNIIGSKKRQKSYCKENKKCYYDNNLRRVVKNLGAGKLNFSTHGLLVAKNDIFSIGLIFLEMATLQIEKDFFNHSKGEINFDLVCRKLSYIKARYSSDFYSVIREMLLKDPKLRPDPKTALTLVYKLSKDKSRSRLNQKYIKYPPFLDG